MIGNIMFVCFISLMPWNDWKVAMLIFSVYVMFVEHYFGRKK